MPESLLIAARGALVNNKTVLSPAYLTVIDGKIAAISTTKPALAANMEFVDWSRFFVLPGFVNAHCHLELTGAGPLEEHRFVPWIGDVIRAKQTQTPHDVARAIRTGAKQLAESGVTTVF